MNKRNIPAENLNNEDSDLILTTDPLIKIKNKLSNLREQDTHNIKIELVRFNQKNKIWDYVDALSEGQIDYDFIREEYRGGIYKVRVSANTTEGNRLKTITFESDEFSIADIEEDDDSRFIETNNQDLVGIVSEMRNWMERNAQMQKDYMERFTELQSHYFTKLAELHKEKAEDKTIQSALGNLTDLVKTKITEDKPDNSMIVEAIRQLGNILPALINKPTNDSNSAVVAELIKQNAELQKQFMQVLIQKKSINWNEILQLGNTIIEQVASKLAPITDNPAVAIIKSISDIAQSVIPQILEMKYMQAGGRPLPQLAESEETEEENIKPQGNNNEKAVELFLSELFSKKAYDKEAKEVAQSVIKYSPESVAWIIDNSSLLLAKEQPGRRNWLNEFINVLKQERI